MDNHPAHTVKAWTALTGAEVDHSKTDALTLAKIPFLLIFDTKNGFKNTKKPDTTS